ncbi:MAG TPA: hypothetical protein VGY55_24165 [Pirellulales bacterium]|jgi:hypothetical protein|nr:hypothetical protein [Pirellulales bacterium]
MDDHPEPAAQNAAAPRLRLRWFQFRLRTLFVLTALIALAAMWVGWQIRIVQERKWLREHYPHAIFLSIKEYDPIIRNEAYPNGTPSVPWYRELFGDEAISQIGLEGDVENSIDEKRIRVAFPEADVFVLTQKTRSI